VRTSFHERRRCELRFTSAVGANFVHERRRCELRFTSAAGASFVLRAPQARNKVARGEVRAQRARNPWISQRQASSTESAIEPTCVLSLFQSSPPFLNKPGATRFAPLRARPWLPSAAPPALCIDGSFAPSALPIENFCCAFGATYRNFCCAFGATYRNFCCAFGATYRNFRRASGATYRKLLLRLRRYVSKLLSPMEPALAA
jgi:hypothetical protein